MQKITPFLWFDTQAEEAANFYVSVFKDSKIDAVTRYPASGAEASGQPEGSVMTVVFKINGQDFVAINGGAAFHFTEAVSFVVNCDTQAEIDYFWEKLSDGGEKSVCGWLKDKYGLSWQITPTAMEEWIGGDDAAQTERVMKVMMQMTKLDMAALKQAYDQE